MENSGIRDAPAIPPGDPESPTSTPTTGDQTPPKLISKPVNRPSTAARFSLSNLTQEVLL